MTDKQNSATVPHTRLSRFGQLSALASRVAGNIVLEGSKDLARGRMPVARELLISEHNLRHLADKLATMRGAAMKAGQLLSMDAGALIPEELSFVLDRLRDGAKTMPSLQLLQVLESNWGTDWQDRFRRFSYNPIAAASIGQVHQGLTRDGRDLAIKIQYPGVKASIDSDLDNVFGLLRLSGVIPKDLDLTPLLEEAREQLKQEADYLLEGRKIGLYREHLSAFRFRDQVEIPAFYDDISTPEILCMEYMHGKPFTDLSHASQAARDQMVSVLFELFFAEFLHFRCVQTDPNMANYLYRPESRKLVLLDFGATREFEQTFVTNYRAALLAAISEDRIGLRQALSDLGFFSSGAGRQNEAIVLDLFHLATEPMRISGDYDFAASDLVRRIHEQGMAVSGDPEAWHTPPSDVLFLHRKLAGLYLIASRMRARVNISSIISGFL